MSERRKLPYLSIVLVMLLAPFAILIRSAAAESPTFIVDISTDPSFNETLAAGTFCKDAVAGDCSLRQAILEAKKDGVASTVIFEIGSPIVLTRGTLAVDTAGLTIDALPTPPATGIVVEIDGQGASFPAFTITTSAITIKGLSIYGFGGLLTPGGAGILLTGASATGNTISGNYIGVKPNGTTTSANVYGVRLTTGATGNTISGNTIGGSTIAGISIEDSGGNTVQSNAVGIGAGDVSLRNGEAGIIIVSTGGTSVGNTIGGTTNSLANTISGNGPGSGNLKAGILLQGAGTTGNFIRANRIGTNGGTGASAASVAVPNNGDGIRIESGASNNQIFSTIGAPLVVSGNSGYGIRVTGSSTGGNQILGGILIGSNFARNAALPNTLGGVLIDDGAKNTLINSANGLTLIGGNGGAGVLVKDSTTTGTQISNAQVGVTSSVGGPDIALANQGGIIVQGGAQHTTISGNTISRNAVFGIGLSATKTVTVTGNFIGLDTNLAGAPGNAGPGIDIQDDSSNTLIGSQASPNYIAGNTGAAISIAGASTTGTIVSNNTIGLVKNAAADTLYLKAAGNGGDGVLVSGGPKATTISSNVIGSNTGAGVKIAGGTTTTATLSLNQIGWVVTSAGNPAAVARANAAGVVIDQASAVDVLTNTIQLNTGAGISVTSAFTVTIRSNTQISRNGGDGVLMSGASRNVRVLSNVLASNVGLGVKVDGTSKHVTIQSNRMLSNAAPGVQLVGATDYSGSGADPDARSLPNHGIDPPVDNLASPLRIRLNQNGLVSGYVYTDTNAIKDERTVLPASACISCTIQFFSSEGTINDGQGYTPLKVSVDGGAPTDFLTPATDGSFSGLLSGVGPSTLPKQVVFAATDGYGNTSEFGVLQVTPSLSLTYIDTPDGKRNAAPGQTISYTLGLANNGTVDFDTMSVVTSGTLPRWASDPLKNVPTLLNLDAGASTTFTVTLTLPTGTDPSVKFPIADTTTVSALVPGQSPVTRILTTTVLATPVVSSTPLTSTVASGDPGETVTYSHRFFNTGNITVTLDLTKRTVDPADSGKIWATTLVPEQLVIAPGGSADVSARVTVPLGAQVLDAQGDPVRATTFITATAQGFPISVVVSDTTGVNLVPSVTMIGTGQLKDAEAFAEVSFFHSVVNTSNGPAQFCLNYRSNSGSTVLSFTSQNSVELSSPSPALGSCFSLDTVEDPLTNRHTVLRFAAVVKVTGKVLPGSTDDIEIYLTSLDSGERVPNASVIDKVRLTAVDAPIPALWLPLVIR